MYVKSLLHCVYRRLGRFKIGFIQMANAEIGNNTAVLQRLFAPLCESHPASVVQAVLPGMMSWRNGMNAARSFT